MTSSGMKRGLAVAAVSALAATGLPLLAGAANAVPLSGPTGGVVLQTGSGMTTPGVSVHNDGVNTLAHLVATAQDNVTQVEFSYVSGAADPVSIAKVSASNGAFSASWDVPAVIYNTTVTLQAEGFDKDGNSVGAPVTRDVFVSPTATAVDVANAAGSTVNVFQSPYTVHPGTFGVVSGTTSEADPAANLKVNDAGLLDAKYGDPANGIRTFSGVANFGDSYDFGTATDVDQALIHAVVPGSDDNEPVVLKQQQISDVTAVATKTEVPASNPTTKVTVTVKDAAGNPIYGAQVIDEDAAAADPTGYLPSYTNSKGQAVFSATGTEAGVTKKYTVNTDDTQAYDSKVDFQKSVTIKTYADTAAGVVGIASDLGSALDFGEYAGHQVKVQVNDNKGAAENNQTVKYVWTVKPFDAKTDAPAAERGEVTTAPVTDADGNVVDGTAVIPAPTSGVPGVYTLNAYQEVDGNPDQSAGDRSMTPLTLRMGEAALSFTDGDVAQGLAGTSKSFDAKLALEDGTPLAGRAINFTYTPSADSAVSTTQPGDTVRDSASAAHDKTDSKGLVSISLTDPKTAKPEDQQKELGDSLTAAGTNFTTGTLSVDWLKSLTADHVEFGTQDPLIDDVATPGRPVSQSFTVYNNDNDALTDQTFTLTTDNGSFFTPLVDGELVADPAAADGGQYGEWKSLTNSIQVTTDDEGAATYTTAIEKSDDFNDDGWAKSTVSVGGVTDAKDAKDDVYWESGRDSGYSISEGTVLPAIEPLNPGSVKVQLAPAADQTVDIVNEKGMAPIDEDVYYDVIATDQFGNRVQAPVDVEQDSTNPDASDFAGGIESNFEGDPAIDAYSSDAAVQKLTATWEATTNKWGDSDPNTDGVQGPERKTSAYSESPAGGAKLTDTSAPLTWYVRDLEHGQYAVTHTGADTQPVGNVVTQTYQAKDQNGEPVSGLQVVFFRSGPDDLQDGSGNAGGITNDEGQVPYTFQGAKAGKAVTTAVVSQQDSEEFPWNNTWTRLTAADASDTVTFGTPAPTQSRIDAALHLRNTKAGRDVASVNGPNAAKGATVTLYKYVSGHRKFVASKTANKYGNAKFWVSDGSKRGYTTYVARVDATMHTFKDWTPKARIR